MCRTHHHSHRTHDRERAHPVRAGAPPQGPIRAGDADRERVADLLRRHAADGRLDAAELEARLERVYTATYVGEADAALAELPPLRPERPERERADRRSNGALRLGALLAVVATLVVVTSLTGLWALWWLMWPAAVLLGPKHHRHARRAARAARV